VKVQNEFLSMIFNFIQQILCFIFAELHQLVPNVCRCVRNGHTVLIDARNLVTGDLVELTMGDRVPADVRLIAATDFQVDESSLTGETMPQYKTTDPIRDCSVRTPISDLHNIAFMGTLVCSGHSKGNHCNNFCL
jgi:Ca2+-transporting ATPase